MVTSYTSYNVFVTEVSKTISGPEQLIGRMVDKTIVFLSLDYPLSSRLPWEWGIILNIWLIDPWQSIPGVRCPSSLQTFHRDRSLLFPRQLNSCSQLDLDGLMTFSYFWLYWSIWLNIESAGFLIFSDFPCTEICYHWQTT